MMLLAAITVLTNAAFTAAFDDSTMCPAWVSWDIEPAEVIVAPRADIPFHADPRIPGSDLSADYAGSGFDRGHLAPAADFNFDRRALGETYLFTNIAPQDPKLNRGEWLRFESECRKLAASGTVHIVTWPFFNPSITNRIGRVRVPDGFVKVAWGWFGVRFFVSSNPVTLPRDAVSFGPTK